MSLDIAQEQYAYDNRVKTFDPNLSSAAQYSPPPPSTTTQHSTVVTPYIQNASNAVVSTPEISGNCVTYSNIIFLPTNNSNNLDQIVDAIELVKNESEPSTSEALDTHPYKYIVSSDQRFLNTLIRTNDIDNAAHASSTSSFMEQTSSNMIATISGIGDNNLILNDVNQMSICSSTEENHESQNQFVQMSAEYQRNEIFMQAADGQLYRPVQNIYVNNGQTIGSEIISEPVTFTDIEFTQPNQFDPDQRSSPAHYQVPANFIETDSNNGTINQFNINHNNILNGNDAQYPVHSMSQTDKDQQRILLESTMSPLCKFY